MANRVLLNQSALKVSQAGVDVSSATPAQLLFSSDWSAMGIIQSGTISVTTGSWSYSGQTGRYSPTVGLVKSFSSPPLCAFYLVQGSEMVPVGFGSGAILGWLRTGSGLFQENRCLGHIQVGTSNIQARFMFDKQYTPGLPVPTFSVRYFVFDYNT
jgi:hypothetical protein